MSRQLRPPRGKNIMTFLLHILSEEAANVGTAKEELISCLLAVERHKKRSQALRQALEALGADPTDLKARVTHEGSDEL